MIPRYSHRPKAHPPTPARPHACCLSVLSAGRNLAQAVSCGSVQMASVETVVICFRSISGQIWRSWCPASIILLSFTASNFQIISSGLGSQQLFVTCRLRYQFLKSVACCLNGTKTLVSNECLDSPCLAISSRQSSLYLIVQLMCFVQSTLRRPTCSLYFDTEIPSLVPEPLCAQLGLQYAFQELFLQTCTWPN